MSPRAGFASASDLGRACGVPVRGKLTWGSKGAVRGAWLLLSLLLGSCGPPTDEPFIPAISGNYDFTITYTGNCSSPSNLGRCAISPVVVIQNEANLVVQPLGAGQVENVTVVFGTNKINVCDLTMASWTFSGVFDGTDIEGGFTGKMNRTGFSGECTVENGHFLLGKRP